LQKTAAALEQRGLHLNRLISTEDIVYVLGEWKLHSPEMFSAAESRNGGEMAETLALLREEISGRTGRSNHP
jgi:hypothetical protein